MKKKALDPITKLKRQAAPALDPITKPERRRVASAEWRRAYIKKRRSLVSRWFPKSYSFKTMRRKKAGSDSGTGSCRLDPPASSGEAAVDPPPFWTVLISSEVSVDPGGRSGVELAGVIAVDYPEKKVTLVHRGPRLLKFIGPKAASKALDWLKSKEVEVLLGQSVDLNSISDGEKVYTTSGGEKITADSHFVCVGRPLSS